MIGDEPIQRELDLDDVITRTFRLFKRDFWKYLLVFLPVQAVIGVLTTLVKGTLVVPTLPTTATPQQALNFLPGLYEALILQIIVTTIITWLFGSIAYGTTIKFASEVLQKDQAKLRESLSFAFSKLLPILAVSLVTGVLIGLGIIALIVPGIILAIMFSLTLQAVVIENPGILGSLERSRKLVANRWLKTFGFLLIFGIIGAIGAFVANLIGTPFGEASTIVTSLLGALYLPLTYIGGTVYYYSNVARLAQPQTMTSWMAPAGYKYCPSCGSLLANHVVYCWNCGTKQPPLQGNP